MNGLLQLPGARTSSLSLSCAEAISLAEHELAAFVAAVRGEFGLGQATTAAQEWLEELKSLPSLSSLSRHDFRRLTVAASRRLAGRVSAHIPVSDHANLEIDVA